MISASSLVLSTERGISNWEGFYNGNGFGVAVFGNAGRITDSAVDENTKIVWEKTQMGNLLLTVNSTTCPVTDLLPGVTLKARITEHDLGDQWWNITGVSVRVIGTRDGKREQIVFKLGGILKVKDVLDPENKKVIYEAMLNESQKRFDGCTYINTKLPMKTLLDSAFRKLECLLSK